MFADDMPFAVKPGIGDMIVKISVFSHNNKTIYVKRICDMGESTVHAEKKVGLGNDGGDRLYRVNGRHVQIQRVCRTQVWREADFDDMDIAPDEKV